MKFTISVSMCPADQMLPVAIAAEQHGWYGITLGESVFFPEKVDAKYPYTPDGSRFWSPETPFVDPWVAIPAMAAVTQRLFFHTRQPERCRENSGVNLILVECFDDALGGHLLDCKFDSRITACKFSKEQGHQIRCNCRDYREPELTGQLIGTAVSKERESLEFGEDYFRLFDECLTVFRGKNRLFIAVEQHNSQLFLELPQLSAQCGL